MSVLDEVAIRLVGEGVGLLGTSIFLGSSAWLPTDDRAFISIVETGGTASARTQNDTGTERPTLQLKARCDDQVEARKMLKAAYKALGGENGLHNVTLNNTKYLSITARQGPTDTGQDAVGRATFSFNVEIEKQPS